MATTMTTIIMAAIIEIKCEEWNDRDHMARMLGLIHITREDLSSPLPSSPLLSPPLSSPQQVGAQIGAQILIFLAFLGGGVSVCAAQLSSR